ncbi:unnamed protein product [Owenia fusiformis]|uniref:Beta-1,3-galactosyl-O-glycosyl-glycoprotein beta-1,6-N-acetylglucosaminyltransferase n=1 Tax=Owenia fusiformis TaxID=6347 RepID=A0A8S4NEL7_OWEFU|nr:unnamed protein product [Owenia fusiformis]
MSPVYDVFVGLARTVTYGTIWVALTSLESSINDDRGIKGSLQVKHNPAISQGIKENQEIKGDHGIKYNQQIENYPGIKEDHGIDIFQRIKKHPRIIKYNLTRETKDRIPISKVLQTNCSAIFMNKSEVIENAQNYMDIARKISHIPSDYIKLCEDCEKFHETRKYILNPVNSAEYDFPLAFDVLLYKDVEQFERLLHAIYRPWNYYCIHVDAKTDPEIFEAVKSIVDCLVNVFISSRRVDVQWGDFSVLEPNLICMQDLWKYKKWKYYINLTGQELPLRSNLELVGILRGFNGANNVRGSSIWSKGDHERWKWKAAPIPYNLTLYKGEIHIAASRAFVDYVLHNEVSHALIEWLKDTGHPDETFFPTLNHNPQVGVPGSVIGVPETNRETYLLRYKHWITSEWYPGMKCHGKYARNICIPGLRNLHDIVNAHQFFLNKLELNFQPFVMDCLEEWYFEKVHTEYQTGYAQIDLTYYAQFPFVKNHV